jgi:hypothetical protein
MSPFLRRSSGHIAYSQEECYIFSDVGKGGEVQNHRLKASQLDVRR